MQQHLGDDRVRAVAMDSTDGLARGIDVVDTGGPITVPVGEETLGRLWNVLGEPVDEKAGAGRRTSSAGRSTATRPRFRDLSPKIEIFETGIKVIDLIAPFVRGGKVGLFGGAGRRQDRPHPGADPQRRAASTAASPSSRASASARARATTSGSRCRSRA